MSTCPTVTERHNTEHLFHLELNSTFNQFSLTRILDERWPVNQLCSYQKLTIMRSAWWELLMLKNIAFLGELFQQLFIFIQFFENFDVHVKHIIFLCFIIMLFIYKYVNLHFWSWTVWNCHKETFVLLEIIVFQTVLDFNCFQTFYSFLANLLNCIQGHVKYLTRYFE